MHALLASALCSPSYLEVLVFGHDGDLVAVHTEDFSLQVDQLPLTHLHVVTSLQVVFTLLTCAHITFFIIGLSHRFSEKPPADPKPCSQSSDEI